MGSRTKRHTHKYYKADLSMGRVWACALPDCTHYQPQHLDKLLPGKSSICWQCGATFTLHELNMRNDRPVCDNCRLQIGDSSELPLTDKMREFIAGRD